uniref:RNA methyltransferase n=1 Tax=Macrostomum lignano TaxID=282301 RepID=A0A1I8IVR4_9PLAT
EAHCRPPAGQAEPSGCSSGLAPLILALRSHGARPRAPPEAGRELTKLVLSTIHGEIQSQAGRRPQVQYERPGGGASSDPLNLRWVAAESQRRELAGLSPMPGDSALGSPVLPPVDEAQPARLLWKSSEAVSTSSACAESTAASRPSTTSASTAVNSSSSSTTTAGSHRFKRPAGGNFGCSGGRSGGFFQPIYGNYRAYYGKRLRAGNLNIGRLQDDRLELLQPDWYLGRDVLDIGCNDGIFILEDCRDSGVKSLTGVDIDGHLVQRAQRNLRLRVREAEAELRLKRNLAREGYQVESRQQERTGFPYNVFFQAGNYVLDSEEQLAKVEENKYDIIQAFSITKWIHLNWGDRGLKLFFPPGLRPDGKLILEPQPFQSYKKKLLCPEHKRNYANIEMRPEKFREYLEREVGFAHSLYISEQQQYHGFQRPVLMCTKPTGRTPALQAAPAPHTRCRLARPADRAESQRAAVAMAAVSSAAETPESIRLAAASPPQLDDGLDSFDEERGVSRDTGEPPCRADRLCHAL